MSRLARLEIVIAGDTRTTVEEECSKEVWRSLADNGFIDRMSVSCVGFHRDIASDSLLVVLPKAFNSVAERVRLNDPSYKREQIYQLIRVFKKIRKETGFTLRGGGTNQNLDRELLATDPVLDSFDAALRLRRDYFANGLYERKITRQSRNKPNLPVNWSQTIRQASTMISGTDVFFDTTVHYARSRDTSHPLRLLQSSCLKEIFKLTGGIYDSYRAEGLEENTFSEIKANPRRCLRDLRASIFDERGRFLISVIGSFLSESRLWGLDKKIQEELLSYTKDFEDIWERVLRNLMTSGPARQTLPAGEWFGWPNGSTNKGIQPKFDIHFENENADILIDAKDYRLLNGAKWQATSGDHFKQIIYRKLLAPQQDSKVINILAFPSLGQKSLFAIRGCHHWKEIQGSCVFEVSVDYDRAVKRWLCESSLDVKKEIDLLLKHLQAFSAGLRFAE